LIEELGLFEDLTNQFYEFTVYIPMTNEELKEAIRDYIKDSTNFPVINSWNVSNITNFEKSFRVSRVL